MDPCLLGEQVCWHPVLLDSHPAVRPDPTRPRYVWVLDSTGTPRTQSCQTLARPSVPSVPIPYTIKRALEIITSSLGVYLQDDTPCALSAWEGIDLTSVKPVT